MINLKRKNKIKYASIFMLIIFIVIFINPTAALAKGRTKPKTYKPPKSHVTVKSYYRKDGTYVRGHVRTHPDGILSNNLSYNGYGLEKLKTSHGSDSKIKTAVSKNCITIGMCDDQVKDILGKPTEIKTEGTEKPYYKYKNSYIYFDNDLNVMSWDNNDNLNIYLGDKTSTSPLNLNTYYNYDQVINQLGTPKKISVLDNLLEWVYDEVTIKFDSTGYVSSWKSTNDGNNMSLDSMTIIGDDYFTIGDSLDKVKRLMGEPTHQSINTSISYLVYGNSTIWFRNSIVYEYNNYDNNLKIPKINTIPNAQNISIGSTEHDVLCKYGTPEWVSKDYYGTLCFIYDNPNSYGSIFIYINKDGKVERFSE